MGNWRGSGHNQLCLEELTKTTEASLKAVCISSLGAGDGLCDCSLSMTGRDLQLPFCSSHLQPI
jgi:hypothetical protein